MAQRNVPGFELLLDAVEGRIGTKEAQAAFELVAQADAATQADLAWIRRFVELSATTVLAAPPPAMRTQLTRRFAAYARQEPLGMLRRLATLSFDSGRTSAAGTRGIGTQEAPRQLIYSTDVADISLNIQPRRHVSTVDVYGQIFPIDDVMLAPVTVQLVRGNTDVGITTSDDLGEWRLEDIPAGTYDLMLAAAGVEVVISAVVLPA